jgi:hypothetical protein
MDIILILLIVVLLVGIWRPTVVPTGDARNILFIVVIVLLVWYLFGHTLPHFRGRC